MCYYTNSPPTTVGFLSMLRPLFHNVDVCRYKLQKPNPGGNPQQLEAKASWVLGMGVCRAHLRVQCGPELGRDVPSGTKNGIFPSYRFPEES